MKTLLAIPGSLRRGSWNLRLLEAAAECTPPGVTVQVYRELANLPHFDEDLEHETNGGPEVVRELRRQVAAADGLWIATPEYNQSFSGVLKNALDWLSRPAPRSVLAGKPTAVVGVTPGRWGTRLAQSALRQVLYACEALVLPGPNLFAREAEGLFDAQGSLTDAPTHAALCALHAAFIEWMERVNPE